MVYAMVAAGLAIIYLFPYVTKAVPSPLVAIIVLTAFSIFMKLDIRTVGDMGELPSTFPVFLLPNIPLTWETLLIILPYSATLAVVGLLESLMTAVIVDDLTDTTSAQEPGVYGPGHRQYRGRLLWRHGRVRHDRPVGDQRQIRRAGAALHPLCRLAFCSF